MCNNIISFKNIHILIKNTLWLKIAYLLSCWKNDGNVLAQCKVATKFQFINNTTSEKHNEAKCGKTRHVLTEQLGPGKGVPASWQKAGHEIGREPERAEPASSQEPTAQTNPLGTSTPHVRLQLRHGGLEMKLLTHELCKIQTTAPFNSKI